MGNGINFGGLGSYGDGIDTTRINEFKKRIGEVYLSSEPLVTKAAAKLQDKFSSMAVDFWQKDRDKNGFIDEEEFCESQRGQKFPCKTDEEAKRFFGAIAEDGKISPERYGAYLNVRTTGDGTPLEVGLVSGGVNERLREVAQKGSNTLGFCNKAHGFDKPILTMGQAIDLVQYGKIKYATTEQIDKGYLKLVKESK